MRLPARRLLHCFQSGSDVGVKHGHDRRRLGCRGRTIKANRFISTLSRAPLLPRFSTRFLPRRRRCRNIRIFFDLLAGGHRNLCESSMLCWEPSATLPLVRRVRCSRAGWSSIDGRHRSLGYLVRLRWALAATVAGSGAGHVSSPSIHAAEDSGRCTDTSLRPGLLEIDADVVGVCETYHACYVGNVQSFCREAPTTCVWTC